MVKPSIVAMLILLARIHESLSPSQYLILINKFIRGTDTKKKLIKFKKKHSHGESGAVGLGYWYRSKRRHADKIGSKRGNKYKLDCDSWTTYVNFLQMYDFVYEEMEDNRVAVWLDNLEWQYCNGNICDQNNTAGCRVTHNITQPERCIVMDEVGSNTSQKDDGKFGGKLLVYAKELVQQKKKKVQKISTGPSSNSPY